MFSRLYNKMIGWARHRHATYLLAGISFAEASVFPLPPDLMLAPMIMARPERGKQLAFITAIFSVLGGLLGYSIGYFAFELIGESFINQLGLATYYAKVALLFEKWGVGLILVAGILPIPYKVFTIAAGVSTMPIVPFIFGSFVARMLRFFIVTALIKKYGPAFEKRILSSIDIWGWLVLGVVIVSFCILQLK